MSVGGALLLIRRGDSRQSLAVLSLLVLTGWFLLVKKRWCRLIVPVLAVTAMLAVLILVRPRGYAPGKITKETCEALNI